MAHGAARQPGTKNPIPTAQRIGAPTLGSKIRAARRIRRMMGVKRKWERGVWKAQWDAQRPTAAARGYDQRWRKFRDSYLAKHPECVYCGKGAQVVHHVIPHRGDRHLFWNNLFEACCFACHNARTAAEANERR